MLLSCSLHQSSLVNSSKHAVFAWEPDNGSQILRQYLLDEFKRYKYGPQNSIAWPNEFENTTHSTAILETHGN